MFNGGSMLVFHSGNNAFPEWQAYNQMIGLGWRHKHFGKSIVIEDGRPVIIPVGEGGHTSHGAHIDALVHPYGRAPDPCGLAAAMVGCGFGGLSLCARPCGELTGAVLCAGSHNQSFLSD